MVGSAKTPSRPRRLKKRRGFATIAEVKRFIEPHLESPEKARAFLETMGATFHKDGPMTVRPIKVNFSK